MMANQTKSQKPCIALMGEFSAGKSTLANLLIGESPLPVQIVATRLPPVRISHGDGAPFAIDLDGEQTPVDLHVLSEIDLGAVRYIQIFSSEDLLQHCDLMDMPGISDPNISSQVWERMIGEASGVLWCSHATQAWRQSEAAVWADMPSSLYDKSLLLLTRSDKLRSPEDRDRVVKRVRMETQDLFRACLPISLLLATKEQENYELWCESGAEAFAEHLVALLDELKSSPSQVDAPRLPGLEGPIQPRNDPENIVIPLVPNVIVPRRIATKQAETLRPPRNPDIDTQ